MRVRAFLERASAVDAPVLIQGETGTGKTLIARHIHRSGSRADEAFVAVNCAGIPDGLFESELFGHARGAFTGAHRERTGLIGAADRGTLFLDEIGDLPRPHQAKLLSAVEDRTIRPVGATGSVSVDFRLVSATCRSLVEERAAGRFRDDLFHRIALLRVTIPPLRERAEDILPLARRFLDDASRRHRLGSRVFDTDARRTLIEHPWPGNVRQLSHVIEAAAILSAGSAVSAALLESLLEDEPPTPS
jgi:DNA-binding NtrC family response regulator